MGVREIGDQSGDQVGSGPRVSELVSSSFLVYISQKSSKEATCRQRLHIMTAVALYEVSGGSLFVEIKKVDVTMITKT